MRIIVPIKQVPETNAVRMDEATGTMIRDGVEAIVNPLDLYAIELAIQLRDQHGGEIIAVSMGPPKAAAALREAISMGVDSGVLVSDKAFAGSDTWATSYVLAAAVRKIGAFDLVICGERATDGDTGQVGPGIAAFLDLPVISYVSKFDSLVQGACRVHRLVENGYELLEMALPGVLTVVKEVAAPRLPTLRGKQKARKAEIPSWGAKDLDVHADKLGLAGSPTRVVKIFRPSVARKCVKHVPTDERTLNEAVDGLVGFLRGKQLI
ncbi:MAG: electron transfer flavoprotein subunit beta/FixA family protein [Planctomycetes bacterium]|jgi:electron transfer flavoprotein beta subunit|nr:electron transfer flavoprotein subunit beta/FixA family protein [Planctomycetota bacterium]